MANTLRDYEDSLKNIVHQNVLKFRESKCNSCVYKGENKFCQVNYDFLPEFQKYRYNACPKKIWVENWGS
jgi:hypothetical protein